VHHACEREFIDYMTTYYDPLWMFWATSIWSCRQGLFEGDGLHSKASMVEER